MARCPCGEIFPGEEFTGHYNPKLHLDCEEVSASDANMADNEESDVDMPDSQESNVDVPDLPYDFRSNISSNRPSSEPASNELSSSRKRPSRESPREEPPAKRNCLPPLGFTSKGKRPAMPIENEAAGEVDPLIGLTDGASKAQPADQTSDASSRADLPRSEDEPAISKGSRGGKATTTTGREESPGSGCYVSRL